jgi:hypothetical protein
VGSTFDADPSLPFLPPSYKIKNTMTDSFLLNRRLVHLGGISIGRTYGGFLVGHPQFISEELRRRLPGELRTRYGEEVQILWPSETILPPYRYLVSFSSAALPDEPQHRLAVCKNSPPGQNWDFSTMRLCWFRHDLKGDLLETITGAAKDIDWLKYAKNSGD